jgi:glycosyltransferase involved in cell wall biosynthesis
VKIANILAHDGWGGIDSKSLERGIGGREGALIRLSREWARQGHEVTNFVATKKPERLYEGDGFFEFAPVAMAKTMLATFPYHACVSWETPMVFADQRIVEKNPVRLIEMQCAHIDLSQQDAANEFSTGVIGLSQWHVDFLEHQGINGPFYVLPNGVDLEHYPLRERKGIPRSHKFAWTSSPDRGLHHLLRLWPTIRNEWPDAELYVGYGASKFLLPAMWAHKKIAEVAVEIISLLKQPGVIDAGQMSQKDVAALQRQCCALPYTCDPAAPTETGCITVIENFAAGNPVVTTDADCLAEEFESAAMICPLPFEPAEYMSALYNVLTDKKLYVELAGLGREFAEGRQWKDISLKWIELFDSLQA